MASCDFGNEKYASKYIFYFCKQNFVGFFLACCGCIESNLRTKSRTRTVWFAIRIHICMRNQFECGSMVFRVLSPQPPLCVNIQIKTKRKIHASICLCGCVCHDLPPLWRILNDKRTDKTTDDDAKQNLNYVVAADAATTAIPLASSSKLSIYSERLQCTLKQLMNSTTSTGSADTHERKTSHTHWLWLWFSVGKICLFSVSLCAVGVWVRMRFNTIT